MTVPMYSSNLRADFMVSDAAMPQRIAEAVQADGEQATQFAKVLNDISSDKPVIAESETMTQVDKSMLLPDDPRELAKKILKGELDVKDIPADKIIPVLKELVVLQKLESFDEDEEEDSDKSEDVFSFNPAQAAVLEQSFSASLQEQIMMLLYRFIESHNERENEDKVTILDGISEALPEYPELAQTLSFPIEAEQEEIPDSLLAQIIENHVEAVQEEEVRANVDTFVKSEELPKTEDSDAKEVSEEFSGLELIKDAAANGEIEKPVVKTTAAPKAETKTADEENVPKVSDERADRAKAISEELEMLRNAKQGRSAKASGNTEEPAKPVQTARPLDADAPIVISGKDGKEIQVRPSEVVAQATKLVEQAISENKEQTEYSLTLNPEELGKITVKLTKAADGAISVTIAAESARTQRILEQNSELMQSNLKSNGVQLESWQTVNESQQETLAQDYNGSSKNPYYREESSNEEEDPDAKSFAEIIAAM